MTHTALKMYDYHVWANGVIIDRLKELPEDIYHKDVSSGFSSVSKVLSHIYLTDLTWFDIISGRSRNIEEALMSSNQLKERVETTDLDEMNGLFLESAESYKSILNSQEDIDKVIEVDYSPYAGLVETSVSELVLHVVTHGSYHRGNIATMLRQMGHTSVMQDYGLYLIQSKME
ncbi:DinB family protein [Scopulibacillus cellulosilyticus]|uniref:DinB family protein n=1 Tax=Scopulibacillus cellulosilyticus TaxID=2665665 RepID=A0ABW2Q0U8_9BACL